jgi:chromosome partitioning protein
MRARIIAVINLKGGIGKTTTVANVAAALAQRRARVLAVDIDAQGNLSTALGITPKRTLYEALINNVPLRELRVAARPNLDLVSADVSLLAAQSEMARRSEWGRVLERVLQPVLYEYDFIFIDCAASLSILNQNAILAATDIVVPTTLEPFAIRGLELLIKQMQRVKGSTAALRAIIPTMFFPRRRQSVELLARLHHEFGTLVLPPVRVNVRLSEASGLGQTIFETDPNSNGAFDYALIADHLSRLWSFIPPESAAAAPQHLEPPLEPAKPAVATTGPVGAVPREEVTVTNNWAAASSAPGQCPICSHPLKRTVFIGNFVVYCSHCSYRLLKRPNDKR